jgi:hypothetical protein
VRSDGEEGERALMPLMMSSRVPVDEV